jgi:hypothetical protein
VQSLCVNIAKTQSSSLAQLVHRYDLMRLIDDAVVNVGGAETFNGHYLPVLERFADRVQEAPLQKAVFGSLGGAFCCGVRASTLALRACDATIFSPTAGAAERLTNDARYRWLSFCAALSTVYLICTASVDVISDDGNESRTYSWSDDTHLIDWCPAQKMAWVEKPQYLLSRLHPHLSPLFFPGQFAHLPRALTSDFGAAINPSLATPSAEGPLARIVRQSIERVIADEKNTIAGWVEQPPSAGQTATPGPADSSGQPIPGNPATASGDAAPPQRPMTSSPGQPSTDLTIDEETGEISAPSPQSAPKENPAQVKSREWLTALGSMTEMDPYVTEISGGRILLQRKAMGFGALPTVNSRMLLDAGHMDKKLTDGIETTAAAAAIYLAAKASRSSS